MGKQRRFWLAVLLAAALGGGAWLMLRPAQPEPVYAGKPLSYWLGQYRPNFEYDEKREAAVRRAGTNALPLLLHMLRARDSSLSLKFMALAQKQHFISIHFVPASDHNIRAQAGFSILGAEASNAVPSLIQILKEKRSAWSEICTVDALGRIGPAAAAAVPALLQSATDPTSTAGGGSLWALGCIGAEPERVVPVLTRGLKDPSVDVRNTALQSLGKFGAAAKSAIPDLIAAARDPQFNFRDVMETLRSIDPAAAEALVREK